MSRGNKGLEMFQVRQINTEVASVSGQNGPPKRKNETWHMICHLTN